jgi:SAM-dependent methyltransferase
MGAVYNDPHGMHGIYSMDGAAIEWNRVSAEYAIFRPGPPISFYDRLDAFGIGLPGQRMLDLGTGTGVLARQFAKQGALVSGIDRVPEQIEQAKKLAERDELQIDFRVSPAEELPFADGSIEIATACQCWLYFDAAKTVKELRRVLTPSGLLATSHFTWLPRHDPVAGHAERLIAQHNPAFSDYDWPGDIPQVPKWVEKVPGVRVVAMFWYDEEIPFTRETWRGRMRASRGVGGTLPPDKVAAFDADLDKYLLDNKLENFTVRHRIDTHIFEIR